MNIQQIKKANYLDILFDGRNKAYGAYELRNQYPKRTRNAIIGVLTVTAMVCTYPLLANREDVRRIVKPAIIEPKILNLKNQDKDRKIPLPPKTNVAPPVHVAAISNPVPVIKRDDLVTNLLKPNDSVSDKAIALKDDEGAGGLIAMHAPEKGDGKEGIEMPREPEVPKQWVDQMPEFNGDLGKWLGAHLKYPERAHESGKEGKVYVQFVVSEDGSISDVSILRGTSPELDEEAMRVVRAMPNWKAGRENGKPVKVWFKQPISFTLE